MREARGYLQLGSHVLLPLGEAFCRSQLLLLCNSLIYQLHHAPIFAVSLKQEPALLFMCVYVLFY
jgi:hypothetical protein